METVEAASFARLHEFIRQRLCERGDLPPDTPLIATNILRRQERLGVEFVLLGPRNDRLSAIWETQTGRVLFYDRNLERFAVCTTTCPADEPLATREIADVGTRSVWQGR